MAVTDEIRDRLQQAFSPEVLEVIDESEKHRGHGGWREGGETHFLVRMSAAALGPMTRISRHRAVHGALGPDLVGRIHALALEVGG
ncbi:BolA family transcriptional regulator [Cereibacter changlensis]|uniref:BolA family transcriptional regulator n=1 Tax=Cereibacter changlensis TaxID=402884 RepID=A0A4U0Z1X9_9RHOB|nr:BolA family protein [Cereibacter changlensis]TKA97279.1 BolA family transcriptional regulator [Cereibacter changlensis]